MIAERVAEVVVSANKISKPSSFRASEAGHLCSRYHYHCRVDWNKRPTPDSKLAHIFRLGQHLEDYVLRLLSDAGVQVVKTQVSAADKDLDVIGHIDGFAVIDGREIPIEIKSVAEHSWEQINRFSDLMSEEAPWLTRWAVQLPLYMYLHACEEGIYVLVNKQTGELKDICVTLSEAMPLLERMQDVLVEASRCIASGNPPDPRPSSVKLCTYCWCRQVGLCQGPPSPSPHVVTDGDMADAIAAAEAITKLRDAHKQYEAAQKALKSALASLKPDPGQRVEFLLGPIPVRVTGYLTTVYDVPAEVKAQYQVSKPSVRVEVL